MMEVAKMSKAESIANELEEMIRQFELMPKDHSGWIETCREAICLLAIQEATINLLGSVRRNV